jgi:hypothetical protein
MHCDVLGLRLPQLQLLGREVDMATECPAYQQQCKRRESQGRHATFYEVQPGPMRLPGKVADLLPCRTSYGKVRPASVRGSSGKMRAVESVTGAELGQRGV